MTSTSANSEAILQCLKAEKEAMTALADLLKEEQAALVEGDVVRLNQTSVQKNDLVRQLADFDKLRHSHLKQQGFGEDADSTLNFVRQSPEAQSLWDSLLTLTAQAKEDNKTNGLMITRRLSQNQTALSAFQQGTTTGSLYGPDGQSSIRTTPAKGLIVR
ncbi:flagella synthesis protein FlgN [Undibacterium sp. WLHG33]|uniref:flagella synthesis protein FlgN n=1 Tax=Undibacterium sp. WLHG33 TaxID=3412482 RepID=UPI003C30890E